MSLPWWKTAVFYQIYPRSFMDSNGDGIGDLPGIVSRLGHLKALGVTALWVSPFFKSPMEDFGYDISDYREVDPIFGTIDDARALIREAHALDLKIIFDLVINHTSDQHPWFEEARTSRDNPKHDWYLWKPMHDPVTGKALPKPNNWVCQFEFKNAWWPNEATDEWYLGTFTRHQPEVDWRNPKLREAMYDVIRFWLDEGIDGFRMDVVNWYVKDSLFRSNPPSLNANPELFQRHIYDRNQPETHEICREIRKIADSYSGDRVLVGEIFTRDAKTSAAYQGNGGDELHLAFNMEMLYLKWDARAIARAIQHWYDALPADGWPNFTLGNHDRPRIATRFASGDGPTDKARLQAAAMLLLSLKGTPFIYYGDEIGMSNARIPREELVDPTGITFWPLPMGRDGERTPMRWNSGEGAGFTSPGVEPWLRLGDNLETVNVAAQENDPNSMLAWYRKLIDLRKNTPALSGGDFTFLEKGERGVVSFLRGERILCALNFTRSPKKIALPRGGTVLLGNRRDGGAAIDAGTTVLASTEALLVSLRDEP